MLNEKIMKLQTEQIVESESPSTPLEKLDKNLSSIFGTELMDVVPSTSNVPAIVPEADTHSEEITADAAYVRSNMYSLMQQGQDALQYAIDLAKQSDSPRAFEVVGSLMKNLSDINMQLLDSHEKKSKLIAPKKDEPAGPQKVVNNSIVFQGSTADLNRMLNDMKKEQ
jgi:hypothetical protein